MVLTLLKQVAIMFLLAGVGFAMYRGKKISEEGSKSIGNILIFLSLPCVIINGFMVEKTTERIVGLGISAALALSVLVISILISRICLGRYALDCFAGAFSNPGFFGVPLIVASFGEGAVFYIAAFIAFLNLFQWTYGVSLLENSDELGRVVRKRKRHFAEGGMRGAITAVWKKLICAPFMVAILVGMFFFLTPFSMPEMIGKCIGFIAGLNTPLAMFAVGIYMAQTDLVKMFVKPRLYLISLIKLVVIPLAAILLMKCVPIYNDVLKMCILIAAACPVGSNIAVYAQLYKKDYGYAVETVIISTILSTATIPLMVLLCEK